jgi:multidrug efflux pump subunit AcrA (membrane-fusion protein)
VFLSNLDETLLKDDQSHFARMVNNIAQLVKITKGRDYESSIEVLGGLQAGDKVVVSGQINLRDGARVSVMRD